MVVMYYSLKRMDLFSRLVTWALIVTDNSGYRINTKNPTHLKCYMVLLREYIISISTTSAGVWTCPRQLRLVYTWVLKKKKRFKTHSSVDIVSINRTKSVMVLQQITNLSFIHSFIDDLSYALSNVSKNTLHCRFMWRNLGIFVYLVWYWTN